MPILFVLTHSIMMESFVSMGTVLSPDRCSPAKPTWCTLTIWLLVMLHKFARFDLATPTFRGLIFLYNDRCKKWMTSVTGNGVWTSHSHHSSSSPFIKHNWNSLLCNPINWVTSVISTLAEAWKENRLQVLFGVDFIHRTQQSKKCQPKMTFPLGTSPLEPISRDPAD